MQYKFPKLTHDAFFHCYSGLTAALPCGPSLIGNQDVAHVSSVLTELNLMTYDLHGKNEILDATLSSNSIIFLLTVNLVVSRRCVECCNRSECTAP